MGLKRKLQAFVNNEISLCRINHYYSCVLNVNDFLSFFIKFIYIHYGTISFTLNVEYFICLTITYRETFSVLSIKNDLFFTELRYV